MRDRPNVAIFSRLKTPPKCVAVKLALRLRFEDNLHGDFSHLIWS